MSKADKSKESQDHARVITRLSGIAKQKFFEEMKSEKINESKLLRRIVIKHYKLFTDL